MEKKYAYFFVAHPGKTKQISVDIEVDFKENNSENVTYGENGSVLDDKIIPLLNSFTESGLKANYTSTGLHNSCRQVEYIGGIDEVIHRILNESE